MEIESEIENDQEKQLKTLIEKLNHCIEVVSQELIEMGRDADIACVESIVMCMPKNNNHNKISADKLKKNCSKNKKKNLTL